MVRTYVLLLLHCNFKVNMLLKNRKEHISTCENFFCFTFSGKITFLYLVEIMKYLGGLFQLFSTSEKEGGNLKKYCTYLIEIYYKWNWFFRFCISGLLFIPLRIHIVSQSLLLSLFSGKYRYGISSEQKII